MRKALCEPETSRSSTADGRGRRERRRSPDLPLLLPPLPSPSLFPLLPPPCLTSLQAGEGQRVLAHEVAAQKARLVAHAEADEAEIWDADAEAHVFVPVGSQRCGDQTRSGVLLHLRFQLTPSQSFMSSLGPVRVLHGSSTCFWHF